MSWFNEGRRTEQCPDVVRHGPAASHRDRVATGDDAPRTRRRRLTLRHGPHRERRPRLRETAFLFSLYSADWQRQQRLPLEFLKRQSAARVASHLRAGMGAPMADRAGSIRAALDANNRACDGIVNLVASTESQLEELRDIVRPINARTLDLDRALRNLSVVTLETEGWLARIDAGKRAEHALHDAERQRVIADPTTWITRLDDLASAEVFFAERSSASNSKGAKSNFSMPGAESARARARELLARCIARTEGEFASAMRAHDARAMGIAHRPDGPRAIASMRSLGIRDENWDEEDEEDTLSPRASSSTPSTPMSPTTARRAHRAALLDVDPGLKSVAQWLLSNPLPSVKKDTNATCTQLYVDARTASLVDATNRDGLAQLCAESAEDTSVNRGKSDGAKFGLGDGEVWIEKTRRWSDAIANCVNRWEAEPALATAVLGAEGGAEGVPSVVGEVLERAAKHALAWLDTLTSQPSSNAGEEEEADKKSDKKVGGHERRGSDLWAMAKKLGGHGTASGSSGGDDSRADDSHHPRPERIFACLDARAALTHLLPQIVRTHGVESAVAREWNAAIVKATEGAHAASASLASTVRREGGRLRHWANALAANAGIEPVTSETRVFAVTVSTFCAALAKRPDARAVLFGGGDSTEVEVGFGSPGLGAPVHVQPAPVGIIEGLSPPQRTESIEKRVSVSDSLDSDGILDFTDSDLEEEGTDTDHPATQAHRGAVGGAESNDTAVTPQFDVPTPVQTKADVSEASFSAMSSLLAEALDAVSCSLEDDDTAGKHRATPNDLEDAIAKQRPTALAKVSSMASKKAASARGGGKTTQNKNNSAHDAAVHSSTTKVFRASLGAVRCAMGADAVRAGVLNPGNEGLLSSLDDEWPSRADATVRYYASRYSVLAWDVALRAMSDQSGPDPNTGMNDKQRQRVKDLWSVVNERADAAWIVASRAPWRIESFSLQKTLVEESVALVGESYARFHDRYASSGFTRKHPEKYIKRTPEEFESLLRSMTTSGD